MQRALAISALATLTQPQSFISAWQYSDEGIASLLPAGGAVARGQAGNFAAAINAAAPAGGGRLAADAISNCYVSQRRHFVLVLHGANSNLTWGQHARLLRPRWPAHANAPPTPRLTMLCARCDTLHCAGACFQSQNPATPHAYAHKACSPCALCMLCRAALRCAVQDTLMALETGNAMRLYLITTGVPDDADEAASVAGFARNKGVEVIAVGVGDTGLADFLSSLASSDSKALTVTSYSPAGLQAAAGAANARLCDPGRDCGDAAGRVVGLA